MVWLSAGLLVLLTGCAAMAPVNPQIAQVAPDADYHLAPLLKRQQSTNSPDALVLLAFSGGGTRAAALSYGVLEELRRTSITVNGNPHSLLKEVDLMAGVSGGSFTALSYALYGERLFDEFEARFLKRNVQAELLVRTFSPTRWGKLWSAGYGRSEMAADYYDEILFDGATYADLLKRTTPIALVTGTELSTGARFEFSQNYFDLMCSDLNAVRLARAAATSSAVPVVLTPVTYRNYGGNCGAHMPSWLQDVADPGNRARPAGRALLRAREIRDTSDSAQRPYIHVVDGGISDNLGLRAMLESFEQLEASPHFRSEVGFDQIKHIVVIVVNSRSEPSTNWDRSPTPPGLTAQLFQSSSVPIDHFSYESVELLKDMAQRWRNRRELDIAHKRLGGMSKAQAEAAVPLITFDAIDVSFDAIPDAAEKRYFMELPTSFVLPNEAVDRLRELAGRLLRNNPAYQALMQRIDTIERARTGLPQPMPQPQPMPLPQASASQ
ncbi:patatin-like phospholipase family protein [Ottowia sp.]|uniref:patatin-like phospholipase family protein n=1 Tax=Ottowia sp. TaxID=1898956 RepID=UPI003A892AC8